MNPQPTISDNLPTIREGETLRISPSSSMIGLPSDELGKPSSYKLQMPNYSRPEHISNTFGGGNLDTVQAYQNIVSLLVDAQKYQEALDVCEQILQILCRLCGRDHLAVATTYQIMGDILEHMGTKNSQIQQAVEYYQEALRIRIKLLGHKQDADTLAIHKTLYNLKFKMTTNTTTESSSPQWEIVLSTSNNIRNIKKILLLHENFRLKNLEINRIITMKFQSI